MASSLPPVVRHLPSDAEIRELLADQIDVQHKSVGMVVGIITPEGRRVVSHGSTSRDGGHAVGGDTAFEIASVTKVFTSLLLVEMVERGEVALDDPLARFLPADVHLPQRKGRHITLVDLATHSSGLPPQPPDLLGLDDPIAPTYSVEQLYSSLSGYRLTRDIGSEWEYGNLDMALLGHALARRAGTDYETLLRARITGPLGLSRTSTVGASLGPDVAVSHDSDLHPTDRLAMGALAPAGAMMSSANDLLTLLGACMGIIPSPVAPALHAMSRTRRSMRPPLLTMMRRYGRVMLRMVFSRRLRSRTSPVFSRVEQALGWYVLGRGSEEMVVHDGAGPSCAASIAYDATARAGVVVLTNAGITVQDISRHLLWRDSPLARPRKQVTLNSGVLDRYVGTYQSPASPLFEILRDGDRLFIRVPYMAKLPFRAESEHDFYVSELQWEFVFDWDGRGRVREMLFGARRGQPMLPLQKRQQSDSPEGPMILPTMMVEIAASRDRVFSFMTNPEKVKQWQPDVVESIPLTKGGVERGTRWRVTVEEFGRRFDVETSVVDLVLNTRLVFETRAPTADVQVDYRFFEHGPHTRVELATTLKPRGVMRIVFPFVKGMIRRKVASRLNLLREVIESTG